MSHLVSRIMLAIFMLPLAAMVYVLVGIWSEDYHAPEVVQFALAGLVMWAFVAVYWLLLWWKLVVWTARRRLLTCFATAVLLVGLVPIFSVALSTRDPIALVCHVFSTILSPLLWLIATVFIWRETPAERGRRVRSAGYAGVACPTCGYNLTGLSESRCPECGSRFTLDELLAAQPAVVAGAEMQ
jgi:hypothetical protein